jgi:Flp pilus assembly pilin Flp
MGGAAHDTCVSVATFGSRRVSPSAIALKVVETAYRRTGMEKRLVTGVRQQAQGIVEYGVVIGVVAVVALTALQAFTGVIGQMFQRIATALSGVG